MSLVPLPFALPLLVAAILVGGAHWIPRRWADVVSLAAAVGVTGICVGLLRESDHAPMVYWFGGWHPVHGFSMGIAFTVDPLGAGLATLAATLVTAAFIYSWRYFDEIGHLYHALLLVFLSAMCGFCLTGDLFNLFVCLEMMSTAAFALTGYKIEDESSLQGSLNFAVTNTIGAFTVLMGIALLYGCAGALNFAQISRALAGHPPDGLILTAFVLIVGGLFIKAAVVPFHFWAADAHAVAPIPICALFSGVMEVIALFGVARVYWMIFDPVLHPHHPALRAVLLTFGAATVLLGGVMCFLQRHLKRLLAFSTISHMGMLLCGLAFLNGRALAGAAVYALGHSLVKASLFFSTGILLARFSTVDEMHLRGKGRDMRWSGWLFLLGGLGLAGLPPFPTALGKSVMEAAAQHAGCGWLPLVFLAGSALTGGAVLRVTGRVYLGLGPASGAVADAVPGHDDRETSGHPALPPRPLLLSPIFLLVLVLALGMMPQTADWAGRAAPRFLDTHAYAATVLDGALAVFSRPVPVRLDLTGILWCGATVAFAFASACLALNCDKLPGGCRRACDGIGAPMISMLRGAQSGDVRDYTAWLVFGLAALGGLMFVLVR